MGRDTTIEMKLVLDRGFASVYFVTDPDLGLATLTGPCLLLAQRILRLEDLARFIVRTQTRDEARIPDAVQMLQDVLADQPLSRSVEVNAPLLVIAYGFAPDLLAVMKRLKLRGLAELLALSGGLFPSELDELFQQLFDKFRASLVYAEGGREVLAFRALSGLAVVSGLRFTVLSTDLSSAQIVQAYPGLLADVSNVRESV